MLYNINHNSYSKIFNQIPYLCTHCIYTHFTDMKNWINNYLCLLLFATTLLGCSKSIEMTAELSLQAEATTGEGAIWHPERESLFWVDIEGCKLYEYAPERQNCREWTFDRMVSTVVPESDSTVVVALQNQIVRLNLFTNQRTTIAPIPDENGKLRCNDGKCDTEGRLWVGTMGFGAPEGVASLYCVWPDGTVQEKLDEVTISNGIVWSPTNRFMYYNDTPTNRIARYRYDADRAEILFDGVALDIPRGTGSPDGMTIDADGNLWVAQWGGAGVYCYNPYSGELLAKINVPAPNVASCAFGGPNLEWLYITTARAGLSEEQLKQYPLSGSVFVCKPGVKGVRANYFGTQEKKK